MDLYESPDAACARIAGSQHGLLTHPQVVAAGMPRERIGRRLRTGRWERVYKGIYRLAGAPRTWEQDLMAACLRARPPSAASHRAAAALWDLDGFSRGVLEISTPRQLRRSTGLIVHLLDELPRGDTAFRSGIPVTAPHRTLIDLAGVAREAKLETALDDALRRGLTSVPTTWDALDRLGSRGRRGTGSLRKLLEARLDGERPAESPLELKLIRLLRRAGLPAPARQFEVRGAGGVVARVDLAYPERRLAVEADGFRYHSGRAAWQRDMSRDNALLAHGWRVLHFSWADVCERPHEVVSAVGGLSTLLR